MPGILAKIAFHKGMKIVLDPLRSNKVQTSVDASGYKHRFFPTLMAWSADLEEQWTILGLKKNACPKCLGGYNDLEVHPCTKERRTASWILSTLQQLRLDYPDADTWEFSCLAKKKGLVGVEEPCWEGLSGDICRMVCVDLLHGIHKMIHDHVLEWMVYLVGEEEMDLLMMAQPHRVGVRNFNSGISKISQWSGKENRALERHLLPAIAGAEGVPSSVVAGVRALLEFSYMAQFPVHTESSLLAMDEQLKLFWASRESLLRSGARRGKNGEINHLKIPKLHVLCHFTDNIRDLGTCDNYSTEVGETLHISMCKIAYKGTNRGKTYKRQMIKYLIRHEKIFLYRAYLAWRDQNYPEELDDDEDVVSDDWVSTIWDRVQEVSRQNLCLMSPLLCRLPKLSPNECHLARVAAG